MIIAFFAAFLAGTINALAGGGTLITFPTLLFLGLPSISANVTSTVALSPGYFGATLAQKDLILTQKKRLWYVLTAGILGGLAGGWFLLNTGEKLFTQIVPYLIWGASLLLAVQEPVKHWVQQRRAHTATAHEHAESWVGLLLWAGGVYGGYFGAGLGVISLAVLGMALDDNLTRLNALKQCFSFSVNVTAALFFVFSGQVYWQTAAVMAVGALLGGSVGGRLAGRISPHSLRWLVVGIGVVVGFVYWLR
jgi:uncharacterized membrane protein YfcA